MTAPGVEAQGPAASAPSGAQYLQLVGYGAALGVPAALVAAGFLGLVHYAQDWLWTDLPDSLGYDAPPWFLVIGLPVVGAALVWAARRFLPGDGGHQPLLGIGGGATPWRYGPSIALAAFGTLAFGAVLGPEAPLIALGSVVGMLAVAKAKVEGPSQVVLATAGSFSAVSALFGGPLVAGVLLLEVSLSLSLGAALIPALLPGLVAAAVGYVLFVGLGSWGGIDEAGLAVPNLPLYEGTRIVDLFLAIAVGLLTGLLMMAVRRLAITIARPSAARWALALFAGGLAVGVIAQVADWLGANSQDVLFSGQTAVPAEIATTSVGTLLILLVAKGLAYAVCLGCGFRGGPVFPAIFLGVAVASICVDVFDCSPTWAVAVGCAAGMAAGTRLVFSALVLSTLLVGSAGFDALPAAVLATVAAWLTVSALHNRYPGLELNPVEASPS